LHGGCHYDCTALLPREMTDPADHIRHTESRRLGR
jgi:hypothetical protein